MQRQSPPKHRHDGTSPLPLGMDWSPPPKKWNGRNTIWPHDPRSGWSYCVTIPSWVVLAKTRDSDPVVFYRVQVGLQSTEGITTTRGVLRRFNDFLKLFAALRKAFPKKNIPPAPPKGLLRMKSRALLEERRCALEQWLEKLLSDIDLSRSMQVASFLELEAAARSSFQEENSHSSEATPASTTISSLQANPSSSLSMIAGSTPLASDYGSDTAYETSEIGTASIGRDNISELGMEDLSMDEDLTSPIEKLVKYGMSNIDEGLFMGQAILDQLEGFPRHKIHAENSTTSNGSASKTNYLANNAKIDKVIDHARKLSSESVGSDLGSLRGSESSNSGVPNTYGDALPFDIPPKGSRVSSSMEIFGETDIQSPNEVRLVLPLDLRQKMNRVMMTMQRRLGTAKTDMEDLVSRLNQETAVKDYLTTKVKDLEVELEVTKQKSRETLQQALLLERERFTKMQWDMEELRRKSLEMELTLKSQQDGKTLDSGSTEVSTDPEKVKLLHELDATKRVLEELRRRHLEVEGKSKADVKVLVKEVKSLRSSQADLRQQLDQLLEEKSEAERQLEQEKQINEQAESTRRKLLHECEILRDRLQQCSVNLLSEDDDKLLLKSSTLSDALDLLSTSDDQISTLLVEAQFLAEKNEKLTRDDELMKMVTGIFIDNARLRKQVNSITRYAVKLNISSVKDVDEAPSETTVQNEFRES